MKLRHPQKHLDKYSPDCDIRKLRRNGGVQQQVPGEDRVMTVRDILLICAGMGVVGLAGCGLDESDPLSGEATSLNASAGPSSAAGGGTFGHDESDMTPQQARMQWLRNGPEPAATMEASSAEAVP